MLIFVRALMMEWSKDFEFKNALKKDKILSSSEKQYKTYFKYLIPVFFKWMMTNIR